MILARLREHTREAHQRLEIRIDILEKTSSLTAYTRLLEKFYGFCLPLEAALADTLAREWPEFNFEPRRKACLLERDFQALGIPTSRLAALPICASLPLLNTASLALGCLYVMEGATLGGKIISRHVQERLGLDAASGAAFFNSYGSETGRMWHAFGETLTHYAETHPADSPILQSASNTFAALEAWFGNDATAYGSTLYE